MNALKPSHAGGVVYWSKEGTILFLLVRPTDGKEEWVLPKGHIESAEDVQHAALREVQEESGVVAQIICPLPCMEFFTRGQTVRVKYFLMERGSQAQSQESRTIGWFSYPDALKALTHAESKEVLQAAEKQRLIYFGNFQVINGSPGRPETPST